MKKILGFASILVLLSFLTGCGSSQDKKNSDSSSTSSSENTQISSSTINGTEQDTSQFKFEETFSTNWTEDWHGLTTKIDTIKIVEPHEPEQNLDGSVTSLAVGVNFTITNNSDRDIMVYPNQGNVVIGDQQGKVDLANSNNDLGGTISPGVTKTGAISYSLSNPVDAASIENLRVLWKATDTKVENVDDYTKDYDVTIELQ